MMARSESQDEAAEIAQNILEEFTETVTQEDHQQQQQQQSFVVSSPEKKHHPDKQALTASYSEIATKK
jgi:hypothetical protein